MKRICFLLVLIALAVAPAPAQTRPDYLTREEVNLVRKAQEPDKRILLFLKFADQRLARFEEGLQAKDDHYEDMLRDRLNDFINAIDDAAVSLEIALERGGTDLRKTREKLLEIVNGFITRVETAQQARQEVLQGDLRYDVEDALMAMNDLLDLGQRIPDEPIPPKLPQRAGPEGEERPAVPGRPTLRRSSDEEEKEPN
jgi:hypothetical protein